tara:strand:- start:401 stop:1276 length:876 start_codon:yes stop_codon:yes gene_type:complete
MLLKKRESCPCCLKKDFRKLYSLLYGDQKMISFLEKYYGENIKNYIKTLKDYEYNLIECSNCKTIFQEYIPTDEFSFKLYEEIISLKKSFEKKRDLDLKNFNSSFNEIHALQSLIDKKSHDIKVLEFGGGWGYWSRFIKSLNYQVFVNELSVTRKKFLEDNSLKIIEDLENTKETFDIIYSDQTFEHLNYPKEILDLLYKKLNRNGLIFLKFPNSFNFKRKLKNNYVPNKDAVHPLEHINLFNLKSFKTMTKDLNLSILNIDKYYKFDFLKHLRILKNLAKFDKILLRKND